jgi:hypothetical protein
MFRKKGVMKKPPSLALLICALISLGAISASAVPMTDPVTFSLSNPNQVTAAPSSEFTTLTFSGTVVVDPNWRITGASPDIPYNSQGQARLTFIMITPAFTSFLSGGIGTYTGDIFTIDVLEGTLPDLYAFEFMSSNPSVFRLFASFEPACATEGCLVKGGPSTFTASQAFSVLVTNGSAVPEGGASILLLGASVAGLCLVRRDLA